MHDLAYAAPAPRQCRRNRDAAKTAARAATTLQFAPLSSAVDGAFWHELGERKIQHYKLDTSAKPIYGTYRTGWDPAIAARLAVGTGALEEADDGLAPPAYGLASTPMGAASIELTRDCVRPDVRARSQRGAVHVRRQGLGAQHQHHRRL